VKKNLDFFRGGVSLSNLRIIGELLPIKKYYMKNRFTHLAILFVSIPFLGCEVEVGQHATEIAPDMPLTTRSIDPDILDLQNGANEFISILYPAIMAEMPSTIDTIFSNPGQIQDFLASENISTIQVISLLNDIEHAIQVLSGKYSEGFIISILDDVILRYHANETDMPDEPVNLDLPCTDAYVNEINLAGIEFFACVGVSLETGWFGIVTCGGFLLSSYNQAWQNFNACIDSTYP